MSTAKRARLCVAHTTLSTTLRRESCWRLRALSLRPTHERYGPEIRARDSPRPSKTNGAASADRRARTSPALAAAAPSVLSRRESAAASPNRLFDAALRSAGQSSRGSLPTRAPQEATGRETSPPLSRSKSTSASPLRMPQTLSFFRSPLSVARPRVNGVTFTRTREAAQVYATAGILLVSGENCGPDTTRGLTCGVRPPRSRHPL